MSNVISEFRGKYYFLSNFYNSSVFYRGILYSNNEAAFQSMKCENINDRYKFKDLSASEAKRLGRTIKLRKGWEEIKEQEMYNICFAKFSQNPELHNQLMATGNSILIEGNNWG